MANGEQSVTLLPRLLGFTAIMVIVVGLALTALGFLMGTGNAGGCFVWPFPLIVGCGLGQGVGATSDIFLFGLLAFTVLLVWFLVRPFRGRKPQ